MDDRQDRLLDGTVGFAGATRAGITGFDPDAGEDYAMPARRMDQDERQQLRAMLDSATAELERADTKYELVEEYLTKALQYDDTIYQAWLLRALGRFELGSHLLTQVQDKQDMIDSGFVFSEEELAEMEETRAYGDQCIWKSLDDANRCLDMQPGLVFAFMRKAVGLFFQADYVLTEQVLQEALEKHSLDGNLHGLMMITKYRLAKWKLDASCSQAGFGEPVKQDLKGWRAYMEDCVRYSRLAMQNAKDYKTAQQGMACLFRSLMELSYTNTKNPLTDAVKAVRAIRVYVFNIPTMCRVEQVAFIFLNKEQDVFGSAEPQGTHTVVFLENDEYICRIEGQRDGGFIESIKFEIATLSGGLRETETFGSSLESFEGTRFEYEAERGHQITGLNWDAVREGGLPSDRAADGDHIVQEPLVQGDDFRLERTEYPADQLFGLAMGDEENTVAFLDDCKRISMNTLMGTDRDDPRAVSLEDQKAACARPTELSPNLPLEKAAEAFRTLGAKTFTGEVPVARLQQWAEQGGSVRLEDAPASLVIDKLSGSTRAAIDAGLTRGQRIVSINEQDIRSIGDFAQAVHSARSKAKLTVEATVTNVSTAALSSVLGKMREDAEEEEVVRPVVKSCARLDTKVAGLEDGMVITKVQESGSLLQHAFPIETDRDLEYILAARPDTEEIRNYTLIVHKTVLLPVQVVSELAEKGALSTADCRVSVASADLQPLPPMTFVKRRTLNETLGASLRGFVVSGVVRGGPGELAGLRKSMRVLAVDGQEPQDPAALADVFEDAGDTLVVTMLEQPSVQTSAGVVVLRKGILLVQAAGKTVKSLGDLNRVLDGQRPDGTIQVALKDLDWDPVKTFFGCPEITLEEDDPRAREARLPDVHELVPSIRTMLKEISDEHPEDLGQDAASGLDATGFGTFAAGRTDTFTGLPEKRRESLEIDGFPRERTATGIFEAADFLWKTGGGGFIEEVDSRLRQEMKEDLQYHLVAKNVRDMVSFGDHCLKSLRTATEQERGDRMEEGRLWYENAAHAARLQTAVAKMKNPTSHMRLDGITSASYCKLANCLMLDQEHEKAARAVDEARKFSPNDDTKPTHVMANILFQQQDFSGALQQHSQHRDMEHKSGSTDLEAAALTNLAFSQYAQQDITSAFANLRTAKELWIRSRYWTGVVYVLNTLVQFCIQFNDQHNIHEGFEHLRAAIHFHPLLYDSTILKYPTDPEMRGRYYKLVQNTYRAASELLFRSNFRRDAMMWAEYGKSRLALDKLSTLIHAPNGDRFRWNDVASYAKRRKCTVLIYYHMMYQTGAVGDTVCIWVVTSTTADSGRLRSFVCDCSASRFSWDPVDFVERCAEEVRQSLVTAEPEPAADWGTTVPVMRVSTDVASLDSETATTSTEETLTQLYDRLVSPAIADLQADDDNLVIIPHGRLQTVPWHALLMPSSAAGSSRGAKPFVPSGWGAKRHLIERFNIVLSHSVEQLLYMEQCRQDRLTRREVLPSPGELKGPIALYDVSLTEAAAEVRAFGGHAMPCNVMSGTKMVQRLTGAPEVHLRLRRTDAEVLTQTEAFWDRHRGTGGTVACRQVLQKGDAVYAERVVAVSAARPPQQDGSPRRVERVPPLAQPSQAKGRLFSAQPLYCVDFADDRVARVFGDAGTFLDHIRAMRGGSVQVVVHAHGHKSFDFWESSAALEELLCSSSFESEVLEYLASGQAVVAAATDRPGRPMAPVVIADAEITCLGGHVNLNPLLIPEERAPTDVPGTVCNPEGSIPACDIGETADLSLCDMLCLHTDAAVQDCVRGEPRAEIAGYKMWSCFSFAREFMGADGGTGLAGASRVVLNTWPLPHLLPPPRRFTDDCTPLTYTQWVQRFDGPQGWATARKAPAEVVPPSYSNQMRKHVARHTLIVSTFWEHLRQGYAPAAALRDAQLAGLREARADAERSHWLSWAGWAMFE